MKFINFSNHPSGNWSEKQLAAARKWGEIADLPFPNVEPDATKEQIEELAETMAAQIQAQNPAAVMCQGEFTLTFQVVTHLKAAGILTLSACSRRQVTEVRQADGTSRKVSVFEFVQFREY